ncbi:MAG: hypothetical protein A2Y15_02970 [Clostridiales bacterium GWF2_36_10]|nr:MAG: hypothetical protein A2Y15_02970 [Clostridiales bacterium GWF2_36_10]HAN20937.1 hypothetical protein [Clostridiales bacterium]
MYLFILAGIILAKIKKYKVSIIFLKIDFYPLFLVEIVYIFFQTNALYGNYSYVIYAKHIQMAFIIVLLLPIILRRLYIQSFIGSGLVIIGTILNKIVINANNGHMPVLPTLSKLTGFFKEGNLSQGIDNLHIQLTESTKLNFLADYIDTGYSIMSIGDLFIHSFIPIVIYYSIKSMNAVKTQGDKML